jgi:hypothetical protein
MKLPIIVTILGLQSMLVALDLPFPVYNPTDSQPKNAASTLKPEIPESVGNFIRHLTGPKDADFIETTTPIAPTTKWRVQNLTIITADVVAVNFTEGHVEVVAIFVRNFSEKRWDLKTDIGGTLTQRTFNDPAVTE